MCLLYVKRGFNASAKSIDPGQPAQNAQADLGRYFLPSVNCLYIKGRVLTQDSSGC